METAREHPGAIAVHGPEGPVTYRKLDRMADRYAAALRDRGVRPGDRVLIWSHKSVAAVAVMQAVLRVGGVYVPVTGSNPLARLSLVVENAGPALVVADEEAVKQAYDADDAEWTKRLVSFGGLWDGAADSAPPEPHRSAPDEPAYILYTSGSTGAPKGVCISHRNALAFVEWAVAELAIGPADRLSNHAPFNFDLSVFDLYAAFMTGASLHLVPQELAYAPVQLVEFLRERCITVWYSVPSALSLMLRDGGLLDAAPEPLRACLFAGEPFALQHVKELRRAWPGVRLLNWYGPTETNVCTSYEVTDADLERDTPLPVGRACSGDTVTLRHTDGSAGDEGEVVVTGPTVMLGYWGREPQQGPYHTGDLARRDEDGDLHYVGRRDQMVKIRGHRVELGEVETALMTLDSVFEAAVVVTGSGLAARLHAVVIPAEGARPSLLAVKRRCAERLPTYMIVDRLSVRDDLPRTQNGKLDRRRLAALAEAGEL
ncbi:D-alanine--poly(phosphoribitol) ligase [Streptomyces armeniacus]|nr:amino acid adenylation domain-containing protein [Streptomyces armeniacus]AXK37442.1 D-alanine--poly(phosphoribitol) ligase [Streptomyces armeniacus]